MQSTPLLAESCTERRWPTIVRQFEKGNLNLLYTAFVWELTEIDVRSSMKGPEH